MPHPRILKALGMTAAEWGALPPEPGTIGATQVSNARVELKKKALAIIQRENEIAEAREIVARADREAWAREILRQADAEPAPEGGGNQ